MIPSKKPTFFYQLGLLAVTVAMILLPIIYLALTTAAGWGVYYFATHQFGAIWDWPIGGKGGLLVKVVSSITPLFVGAAVVLAMIKPIFSRPGHRMHPISLNRETEPQVYQLIEDICELVGSPKPRRVAIDSSVNASASFERGFKGFFGNQLVLTLGMPLVAGLTQRELAGVVAHEFGHFRQGFGMRLSFIIRRINAWFLRIIYERDSWDEVLESWAEAENGWFQMMVGCARAGVWFSRRILWCLMIIGHAISSFLLRQMEYDADAAEIELAGSAAFESTMLKLGVLGTLEMGIHMDMSKSARSGRLSLPDNLATLLQHRVSHFPEEKRQKIENAFALEKTGWLDTHPSAADRIRQARQMAREGYVIPDEPAAELFNYFDSLGKMTTLAHYEDDLNVPVRPEFLIPVDVMINGASAQQQPQPSAALPSVPMVKFDPSQFQGK